MKKRTLTEDALRKVHIEVDGSVVALVVSSSWAGQSSRYSSRFLWRTSLQFSNHWIRLQVI